MIDTEALRKKVIDLAIKGKLTQQLTEDGNAEDLYAQIQKEKAKLIKEGKIKNEKPLPDITNDDIPFEIPSNWKWIRLCDISETNIGLTYHPENIVDDGTIVLRSNNIVNGAFDYSDLVRVNCTVRDSQYIRENDILICSRNGSKRLVGKCAIYDGMYGDVSFGAFMAILRTPYFKYIYFYLLTDCFRRYFSSDDTKQINQVTQDILKKAIVPFPPISEQKRIVEKLEDILAQIDIVEALQQQYESDREILKGKIIDSGIRGKLTEQLPEDGNAEELFAQIQNKKAKLIEEGKLRKTRGFKTITEDEEPYMFPNSWKTCYIDDVAFVTKLAGFEYTKYIADSICDQGVPLFKGKNIQKGELVLEFESYIPTEVSDELPRSQVNKKCLLTPYVGTIGNIALFDGSFKAHLGSNVGKIEILNPDNVCLMEEFLLMYFRSDIGYSELNKHRKATAQDSISIDAIRNVIIAIPPIEEQKRISNIINELLSLIAE